jgi:hypothetical protein
MAWIIRSLTTAKIRKSHNVILSVHCLPFWQGWETEEVRTGFWCGELREGDRFEDLGIDGRIILKRIFKKCDEEVRTELAQHRDRYRTLVNAAINLQVP